MENNGDYLINSVIDDTISSMKWYPNKDSFILATGGWDCKVRLFNINYQVNNNGASANFNSSLALTSQFENPILSLAWIPDQSPNIVTGSTDGSISLIDLTQNKQSLIGKHDAGVKDVCFLQGPNVVISGGWDNRVCFWDLRQPNKPALFFDLGKKIYSMSLANHLLVVAMADRVLTYFNLSKLGGNNFGPELRFESHLKYQTRCVSAFPEANGYAIGSIEGRVAVKYINFNEVKPFNDEVKQMSHNDDFAFRCHRTGDNNSDVYPVNAIAFNQTYGTFCTGGGDGQWMIWDKDSRTRLKQGGFTNKAAITALDYSFNGDILAFAGGYDWSKGYAYENCYPPKIGLHYLPDTDKKKKQKKI